ncbi:MAG: hypothetical protein ACLUOI_37975 [Eisenbergiella sp.]
MSGRKSAVAADSKLAVKQAKRSRGALLPVLKKIGSYIPYY